ncbi:AlbA family DNA-binding domain-containing protein [Eisenibacter elegans]|jgi:predicted HTH transcriptional regulator|uniref:AlbA family DNA-binding domain-containing protein n=1 Tax=Eisenibacter elegans TaxID=997 RepID=UPI000420D446|nr:ATP-binding protein [Eisenibacter elegans]
MELVQLKKLVRQGEGKQLEFKLKANHPEKIIREVVAFANTEGGILLIGVADDKTIKGLKYPREDEYVLTRAIENQCFPPIDYQLERVLIDDTREVLVFHIARGEVLPHYVAENAHTRARTAYIRIDDKSVKASREMREILKSANSGRNFQFEFGQKERLLMRYLEQHQSITVDDFANTANIPRRVASRTLVLLVLSKVLQILPSENQDVFQVADS